MPAAKRQYSDSVFRYVRDRHAGLVRDWFSQLRLGGLDRGELVVNAGSHDQVVYLERYCRPAFIEGAQTATGRLVGVRFTYRNGHAAATVATDPVPDGPALRLNADYSLDEFVVGPCNRLAHAAAVAICDAPGRVYNPLFVYGESGVGKSHLVQAICHRILDRAPVSGVAYLSCDAFANDYVDAVASDAVHRFHDRYRLADILVVEDVQLLASREQSQEEFFHTFNALHQEQRQIVVTAAVHPDSISGLQERLASRFKWGLVVEIDLPCLETRAAMVRKKAAARRIDISDDIAMLVATEIHRTARELEGALAKIRNYSQSTGRAITIELAREAMGVSAPGPARVVRLDEIVRVVARRYGLRRQDLQGPDRSKSVALPRQVCMFLARRLTRHSLQEIGKRLGDRDHTTVLHAERLIAQRSEDDSQLRGVLDELERALAPN